WFTTRPRKAIVRKYAIGSLLPLSSSRVGRRLAFRARLLDRRIEKTAAASVEDTMAPSKSPSYMVKSVMSHTKVPRERAVNKTPMVDRGIPCHRMGSLDFHLVSNPPENRRKFRETIPMNWAVAA